MSEAPGAGAMVSADWPCMGCGYNLVGLVISGKCPECGLSVEVSLRRWRLETAPTAYLRMLGAGLATVRLGILLQVVGLILGPAVAFAYNLHIWGIWLSMWLGWMAGVCLASAGYLRIAAADPGLAEGDDSAVAVGKARRVVSWAAGAQLGAVFAPPLLFLLDAVRMPEVVVVIVVILWMAAQGCIWVVRQNAMLDYAGWLGNRCEDSWLERWGPRYRWLLPLVAVGGACVASVLAILAATVMYLHLLGRLRGRVRRVLRGRDA